MQNIFNLRFIYNVLLSINHEFRHASVVAPFILPKICNRTTTPIYIKLINKTVFGSTFIPVDTSLLLKPPPDFFPDEPP